jgi:hypothetical protein
MLRPAQWLAALSATLLACGGPATPNPRAKPSEAMALADESPAPPTGATAQPADDSDTELDAEKLAAERKHRVVFADRTSQGYLLLIDPSRIKAAPSRKQLDALVTREFPGKSETGELALLRKLIATQPHETALDPAKLDFDDPDALAEAVAAADPGVAKEEDLLGLHVELLDRAPGLLPADALADPIATRDLSEAERLSLEGRTKVLLLRADYRNKFDVRGLRLLQALVRLVALEHDALVFDPDTLETRGEASFTARRLTANLANVIDQLAVIPFSDPERPGQVRLVTRGMRRFGLPDLEFSGLPRDPVRLQRATDLIAGLARTLIAEAELDERGIAIEAPDSIVVTRKQVDAAYADLSDRLPPPCASCPAKTTVHLVRRDERDTDTRDHLTVSIEAPREQSEAQGFNHQMWAERSLNELFGAP